MAKTELERKFEKMTSEQREKAKEAIGEMMGLPPEVAARERKRLANKRKA